MSASERDVNRDSLTRLLQVRLDVIDRQTRDVRDWVAPDQKLIDSNLGAVDELLRMAAYLGIELNWNERRPCLPSDYPWNDNLRRPA